MTFLALESRNDLPKVPYCTALDYYVAIGFGFVFATIVEFAIVHYFTKVGSGEFYYPPETESSYDKASSDATDTEDNDPDDPHQDPGSCHEPNDRRFRIPRGKRVTLPSNAVYCTELETTATKAFDCTEPAHSRNTADTTETAANGRLDSPQASGTVEPSRRPSDRGRRPLRQRVERRKRPSMITRRRMSSQIQELWINSVSKIDKVSRVVFPLTFIVTNVVYWLTYFKEDEIR